MSSANYQSINDGSSSTNDDEEIHPSTTPAHSIHDNTTPLITSPASLVSGTARWMTSFRPSPNESTLNNDSSTGSSGWATQEFLSCSPMVSGAHSSIHLPNLDLREARRSAIIEANKRLHASTSAEFARKERLLRGGGDDDDNDDIVVKRSRSHSLGNERERYRSSNLRSSPLTLGNEFNSRRTPSGLSLLDLSPETLEQQPLQQQQQQQQSPTVRDVDYDEDEGYGSTVATTPTQLYTEPLKMDEDHTTPIKESQSCTIADLGIELSPHLQQRQQQQHHDQYDDTEKTLVQELKEEFASQSTPLLVSLLYGIVNTSIVLPVLMSFGSIIYHDDFFRPYLSVLMKLTVVSGAVHQITFSSVSSLPFAVGQVQDAGLIFLGAMAKDIVRRLKGMGVDDESILATATIGLSIFTALLGGALILVGRFKLASYCQLLPSSVVGGYLAYIGFFCGQAGLALMARLDIEGLQDWYKFLDREALTLLTPGVLGGFAIYFSVRTFRHMAVLPSSIAMIMVIFYLILWVKEMSVEEATEYGWINKAVDSPSWYHTWDYLRIDKVVWRVLPSQTLTTIAMISVVALSSSLDIAAIEIEMKRPLDYNHELKTVGISNIVSGLAGGYTGSYIFSQTIFSLRMGIRSPLMGYVIAFLSLVTVVLPFNVLAYIPNLFFGSLLMMICLDLLFEWLIDVREKVTPAEYVVVLMSFCLLLALGVEFGILAGICLYVAVDKMGFDVGKGMQHPDVVVERPPS